VPPLSSQICLVVPSFESPPFEQLYPARRQGITRLFGEMHIDGDGSLVDGEDVGEDVGSDFGCLIGVPVGTPGCPVGAAVGTPVGADSLALKWVASLLERAVVLLQGYRSK